MSEGKRPGGLTALAVINFILALLGVVSILGLAVLMTLGDQIPTEEMEEVQRAQFEAMTDMGTPMFMLLIVLTCVTTVLLLGAGVGYLKQKKLLGRTVGNVYALVAVVSSVVTGVMFPADLGGGFNLGTIIGLIYPALTLFLLNVTFKEDFVN